jgi:ankyrin repeat protein
MFVIQSKLTNQKALEIFEALDQDKSDAANYFIEKCGELPVERLIRLRDNRPGNEGRTLLHNAARYGSLSAALSLLRVGHPVEPIDSSTSRVTPLMEAVQYKHIEVIIILLEAGASLFTQDINGENALHYAARSGGFRLLHHMLATANLSKQLGRDCASYLNVKKQFPEDLARNQRVAATLRHLRMTGSVCEQRARPGVHSTDL